MFPLVLGYLLPMQRPCLFPDFGDGGQWFNFWAAYAGGVISCGTSYYILYVTIRNSREERKIEFKREDFNYYTRDIAERFSQIFPAEIIRLDRMANIKDESLRVQTAREEMFYLQEKYAKYNGLINSATVIYGNMRNDICKRFLKNHNEYLQEVNKITQKFIVSLSILSNQDLTNEKKQEQIDKIFEYAKNIQELANMPYFESKWTFKNDALDLLNELVKENEQLINKI